MEKSGAPTDIAAGFLSEIDSPECIVNETIRDSLPPIDLIDKRIWWLFRNGEGEEMLDTVSFAEHWARIMQSRINEGEQLEAVWLEAWEAASDSRTTEHTMVRAVSILARSWRHGSELRHVLTNYQKSRVDPLADLPEYPF